MKTSNKNSIENIFCLPVNDDLLVYSPLNEMSALLNYSGAVELKKQIKLAEKGKSTPGSQLAELAKEIIQTPTDIILRKTGPFNPEFLGLLPTRGCNGACNYCDFGAGRFENVTMTYDLAIETVNWYSKLMLEQKREILEIHFFGGEPMVAFDLIEVAVHRARLIATKHKLFPYFEISTNGQYIENRAKWLGYYFNKVILSFDGFRDIQDTHRPLKGGKSSFDNVFRTAKIIGESNAELCIRCCVSQLNIGRMKELTHWFCQNFRLSVLNFEILSESEITKRNGLFAPNPIEFAVQFQKSRKIARSYGIEIVYASDISASPQVTSCPVGKDTAIVSPDGRISNCYLLQEKWQEVGLDLEFGMINTTDGVILNHKNIERIRNIVEDKPRCEKCFCKWSCSGGCHVGTSFPGSSLSYDAFCKQTRLISLFSLLDDLEIENRDIDLLNDINNLQIIASQSSDRLIDLV